ncbi:MAG TPA: MBL fold metallo-hydrolase [Candidatus Limnocylindria bacterium]|nr:MBL fold metallo-hydrolase [Candidatus Limnocylindria bacterium]
MEAFVCRTCGVQYAPAPRPPDVCPICEDERQYVGWDGQRWTTMAELRDEGHTNTVRELEPGLFQIATTPAVAIGQRALLARTTEGLVMWDCVTVVDDASVRAVHELGGLRAIAISHPHFYASMATWSEAFGDCPIYIHAADARWVQHPTPALRLWDGTRREILPGVTLVNTGGHFDGSQVLHWADGADGRGLLLSGDSVTVVMDRRFVSFMYSYPNLMPLSAETVRRIVDRLRPFRFERIYGAWDGREVVTGGRDALERSAERYIQRLGDALDG